MSFAKIKAIEYHLPEKVLTNDELSAEYPEWTVEKIEGKTGIASRRVAAPDEFSSDLAVGAARKLFTSGVVSPADIDFLLFCTQSPDYFLPTTACTLQHRLGMPITVGALDYNLGCSGYIYGLGLAKGLIESDQAKSILLLTAETYTKFIHLADKSVRTLFGDGASATWIRADEIGDLSIGPFVYGSDGSGGDNLIVPAGGMRKARDSSTAIEVRDQSGNVRSQDNLFMNGPEVFAFTLEKVPLAIAQLLERGGVGMEDIDLFVFHQANAFMLEQLRKKVRIPEEKYVIAIKNFGNTVSSTIPIALKQSIDDGRLKPGMRVLLTGFGVGYSWGACLVRW